MFKDELLVAEASPLFSVARESMESSTWDEVPIFDDPLY